MVQLEWCVILVLVVFLGWLELLWVVKWQKEDVEGSACIEAKGFCPDSDLKG